MRMTQKERAEWIPQSMERYDGKFYREIEEVERPSAFAQELFEKKKRGKMLASLTKVFRRAK